MSIGKFLDPKNDVAFKKIFGTEKNKDILIHFLNDMLIFKERLPIRDVSFIKTVQDPEIAIKKTSLVDILCKDEEGNSYIVEMQVARTSGFEKRAQYYASKAYISQMDVGGQYTTLKEVIFLAIVDYVMFPEKVDYKSDHIILDKKTHEHDLKDFSFTFLELGKFTKTQDQLSTLIEKWAYFFKHGENTDPKDLKKIFGEDLIIQRAYNELNRFYWGQSELLDYEAALKKELDYIASMDYKFNEGVSTGISIGFSKGQAAVIKQMLSRGLDIQRIAEVTGISLETIQEAEIYANLPE